ncbi:MAG: RNA methyltransferase [Rhodospirillales bacterium]
MAGTDSTKPAADAALEGGGPAIVLIEPQLGENIGMAARAMLNCGLTDLRLVRPRDGWPNEHAVSASSGAVAVIERVRLFERTEDAIADLETVYASTARPRDMTKDVFTPRAAAADMRAHRDAGLRVGVLFGRESKGLKNDDIALADAIVQVPLNPAFSSLNIAQAVFVIAYEWFQGTNESVARALTVPRDTRPANKQELVYLFEHLERELDACGFLRVTEKRPIMVRNIRNIFQRAALTEQEVRTLRGVITGLVSGKRKGGD